ncbi:structural polyprotein [Dicistroviridae TZ-3]|nr:structural polyprotein [Dicistroviridae TZ-3]
MAQQLNTIMETSTLNQKSTEKFNENETSLLGDQHTEGQQDVVEFVSDGAQQPLSFTNNDLSNIQHLVTGGKKHMIEDFLARPVLAESGSLSSQDVYGKAVHNDTFLGVLFNNPVIANKMKDFYAGSFTFCARITVNAQPFHTGLYYLTMYPIYNLTTIGHPEYNKMTLDHYRTDCGLPSLYRLPHVSGFPGAYISLGATSEQIIRVPYVGMHALVNLCQALNNLVSLVCVTPLRGATNSERVPFNLYYWLEDVNMIGTDPYEPMSVVQFQGNPINMTGNKQTAAKESQRKSKGVVSSVAGTVSDVASSLSRIPVVGDIAGPVSWAADAVSGIASIFGFSKPIDQRPVRPVLINPHRDMPLSDGTYAGSALVLNRTAGVVSKSLGPVEEDEMSINYIINRPNLINKFTWSTENTVGEQLFWNFLIPSEMHMGEFITSNENTDIPLKCTSHTYMSYLSTLFMYYRGTISITFNVVANNFYSGRLRIRYVLNTREGALVPGQYSDVDAYSQVMDIRTSSVFKIDFPFVDVNPWRSTNHVQDLKDVGERMPMFQVFVETPLMAPDTVNPSIDVWMSVSGGEDFMFSGPRMLQTKPLLPKVLNYTAPKAVVLQGFIEQDTSDNIAQEFCICERPPAEANAAALASAVGDPIVSLRTLAKRQMHVGRYLFPQDAVSMILPFLQINNFYNTKSHVTGVSYIDKINALFRFRKGGMRFTLTGLPEGSRLKLVDLTEMSLGQRYTFINQSGIPTAKFINLLDAGKVAREDAFEVLPTIVDLPYTPNIQGSLQFEVPYYSIYQALDAGSVMVPEGPEHRILMSTLPQIKVSNVGVAIHTPTAETGFAVDMYIGSADDYNAGYLIGPPIDYRIN